MIFNQKAEIKSLRIENEELGVENDELADDIDKLAEENELLKADLKRFLQVKQEITASKGHPSGEYAYNISMWIFFCFAEGPCVYKCVVSQIN